MHSIPLISPSPRFSPLPLQPLPKIKNKFKRKTKKQTKQKQTKKEDSCHGNCGVAETQFTLWSAYVSQCLIKIDLKDLDLTRLINPCL